LHKPMLCAKTVIIRGGVKMPTISMFYGILIRMFYKDTNKHNLPHIHAEYQGEVAIFSIPDGNLLAGKIPSKKEKLVMTSSSLN